MTQQLDVIGVLSKLKTIIRRRFDLIVLPTLIIMPCAFLAYKLAPRKYRSSIQLHIKQTKDIVDGGSTRYQPRQQRQRIELLIATMKSYKILARLLEKIEPGNAKTSPRTRTELVGQEIKVLALRKRVNIFYLGHGLVQLSYVSGKPKECLKHINVLLTLFLDETLRPHQRAIRRSASFLEKQLQWMGSKLHKKEVALTRYRKKHKLNQPKTFKILSQNYLYLKKNLNQLQIGFAAEKKKLSLLQSRLRFLDPGLARTRARLIRLLQLQLKFARLRAKYTFKHPEVREIRKKYAWLIARLKRPQKFSPKSMKALIKSLGWRERRRNPAGTKQDDAFSTYESSLLRQRTLKQKIIENRHQMEKLEQRLEAYPAHEQTLRKLQRDVDISQALYLKLITLYQQTLLKRELEVFDASRRVQVIEPARLPLFPVSPKRFMFLAGGLAAAFALSLLMIVLAELFHPSLQNIQEAGELLNIEVLGEVDDLVELKW